MLCQPGEDGMIEGRGFRVLGIDVLRNVQVLDVLGTGEGFDFLEGREEGSRQVVVRGGKLFCENLNERVVVGSSGGEDVLAGEELNKTVDEQSHLTVADL
jgi:hypothetical protein